MRNCKRNKSNKVFFTVDENLFRSLAEEYLRHDLTPSEIRSVQKELREMKTWSILRYEILEAIEYVLEDCQ